MKFIICLVLLVFCFTIQATPREIVIIRHADKLDTPMHGESLSPTGFIRSVNFAFYFKKKFGYPDYIIATRPVNNKRYIDSIRELQTVLPLENMMAMSKLVKPGNNIVLYPYTAQEYIKMIDFVVDNPKFKNKLILICWDHHNIQFILRRLLGNIKLPAWKQRDFGQVDVIKFKINKPYSFHALLNQYPTDHVKNWQIIQKRLNSD
jgi:hypothetical protein